MAQEGGRTLNVTQVQKLLYIAYGALCAKNDRILLDEPPHAWPYGPVFPKARKIDYGKIYNLRDQEFAQISADEDVTAIFRKLASKYSSVSAGKLSDWSHTVGSPWDKTTKMPGFAWNDVIPNQYIKEYFSTFDV